MNIGMGNEASGSIGYTLKNPYIGLDSINLDRYIFDKPGERKPIAKQ